MKKSLFIILGIFINASAFTSSDWIEVYSSGRLGEYLPEYIILKHTPYKAVSNFEHFIPGVQGSFLGEWNIKNDTLILSPKYTYSLNKIDTIEPDEYNLFPKIQKFIIRGDSLIDVENAFFIFHKITK